MFHYQTGRNRGRVRGSNNNSPTATTSSIATIGSNSIASHATITLLVLHYSLGELRVVDALTCMTCVTTLHQSSQLDRFRVTARLPQPTCQMEPIVCDRDQDVCVTITMHIGQGYYWIGAGCDKHEHFEHMSCQNIPTMTRNVQLGTVHERKALQRVCVCKKDRCNGALSMKHFIRSDSYLMITTIFIAIMYYLCTDILLFSEYFIPIT
ncbi:unnamed protein product [Anisakis simplex]|uniref:Protein quiver n=1 Tax=Anisakis simplex TaxID=6269 RepID=A0A0M3K5Q7_ANISI|nr:unnamed protein product [Anisakis simplex]